MFQFYFGPKVLEFGFQGIHMTNVSWLNRVVYFRLEEKEAKLKRITHNLKLKEEQLENNEDRYIIYP